MANHFEQVHADNTQKQLRLEQSAKEHFIRLDKAETKRIQKTQEAVSSLLSSKTVWSEAMKGYMELLKLYLQRQEQEAAFRKELLDILREQNHLLKQLLDRDCKSQNNLSDFCAE